MQSPTKSERNFYLPLFIQLSKFVQETEIRILVKEDHPRQKRSAPINSDSLSRYSKRLVHNQKSILLADDYKFTDTSILDQIQRP